MIVDSSAIVALARSEADAVDFTRALNDSRTNRMSAGTWIEVTIVIDGAKDPVISGRLDELLDAHRIMIEDVTAEQARIARQAYRDYGRGSGHRAQLNFGDCFAYALAKDLGEPLLYKGDDFVHTDVRSALRGIPSTERLAAQRRGLPPVDPEELRRDIDGV